MRKILATCALVLFAIEAASLVGAAPQPDTRPQRLGSLKSIPRPEPSQLGDFVKDRGAAIALGKALFWDMQVGGDGQVACASCHFQAGADSRSRNQLNPGANHRFDTGPANRTLAASDFPFHQLATPDDPKSGIVRSRDDVAGSQGVHNSVFDDVQLGGRRDAIHSVPDPDGFAVDGSNVRRVTGRNTPSVINAVLNVRNFWDGRANDHFNGRNPFGDADAGARVLAVDDLGEISAMHVSLDHASLASQAVGPPNNGTEMSAQGRNWLKLGKKMCSLRPLDGQEVKYDDSVLGHYAISGGTGLAATYPEMIRAAFKDKWWNSNAVVDGDLHVLPGMSVASSSLTTDQYTVMEANFSLFWGLAISMYEATLVSDDSPFDRFLDGDKTALTKNQQDGFGTFQSKCASCHSGAELSNATWTARFGGGHPEGMIKRMQMADGHTAVYDGGFYNIGVRPTTEDIGVGGSDPFGNPLSSSKREQLQNGSVPGALLSPPVSGSEALAVNGAFKVPILRNVELTGPYFHNGSAATLQQVVEFYTRGGNFPDANRADLDPEIQEIGKLRGSPKDQSALVDFLVSLTDDRVRYYRAPFDHPALALPDGAKSTGVTVLQDLQFSGLAEDEILRLPATGANGQSTPVAPFLGLSPFASASAVAVNLQSGDEPQIGNTAFGKLQSSPNPAVAREGSLIQFALPTARQVSLQVFDVSGRLVRTLHQGMLEAGSHSIKWDGRSEAGRTLPGGVYLYRLSSGGDQVERKLVLVD